MTAWRYILASLRHYRRVHVAVAAGVAVATAVITGALLVGDSMRGSLQDLAIRGLGRVDVAVIAEHPFRVELVDAIRADQRLQSLEAESLPLVLTQGAATFRTDSGAVRRATGLSVYGITPDFWSLAPAGSREVPASGLNGKEPPAVDRGNEIALIDEVARELGVEVGDFVVLRIPLRGAAPTDSSLGEKEDASASRRLKVTTILSARDAHTMARFGLRPSQRAPRNAFVPLETLQEILELDNKANAIVIATSSAEVPPAIIPRARMAAATNSILACLRRLRPELSDYGLTVEEVALGEETNADYVRISADRLVLPRQVVDVANREYAADGLQPVITYLANTISAGDHKIPYSTVVGVDSTVALGPVRDDADAPVVLADDEIALNDWAAEDLGVEIGEEITITFYEPETTHGVLREHEPVRLRLRAIVPLADAEGRPTAAADPKFAPELPGVTDSETIESWELPFQLVEEVRDKDETYWDEHRTTPKAFVSFALAKRLWATRWGTVSVLRIPAGDGRTAETTERALREKLEPAEMGMAVLPVKRQALAAASGTTPFDGLFLGFSFFLMASAVMLTALLFRLGVEQRAREVGLLLAAGWSPRRLRRVLLDEAAIVAIGGAIVGAAGGAAYAAVMVHGLNTWWVDATTEPFLKLHVSSGTLIAGMVAGLAVGLATMWWSLRRFARLAPRQLLAGDHQPPLAVRGASRWSRAYLPAGCLVVAVALGLAAIRWEGEAQAGAFFGGGVLALVGILAAVRGKLLETAAATPTSLTLAGLAACNVRRNPSRTMLSLALAATASFLIVALSAFRLAPTERGTGGFALLATADLPLHYDLNTPEGREELGFPDEDSARLAGSEILGFRVRDGEDASCLNLYQTTQPRVLGAPPEIAEVGEFQWAMRDASVRVPATPPSPAFPAEGEGAGGNASRAWRLLDADLGNDANGRPVVPMVLDRNTAFYSLKLYALGDQLTIRDSLDREVTLQIVGMLANSILQGDVVVSEANFLRLFPEAAGRRFFLVRLNPPPLKGGARGGTPAVTNSTELSVTRSSEAASDTEVKEGRPNPESDDNASVPPISTSELASLLETKLEDFGFDAVDARQRLAALMAVQNTYLSTFQMLGGLGLMLGAVGLAVVQLRSVLERRGELALLQATGFRRRRLVRMVLAENLVLLLGGLGIGCGAALAAVLPHALIEQVGVPWRTLAALLALVVAAGVAAAYLAARSALARR